MKSLLQGAAKSDDAILYKIVLKKDTIKLQLPVPIFITQD